MFNPLTQDEEFRPALAPRKKKFKKPSDAPIDKLNSVKLDVMLLQDFWDYIVGTFPTPPMPLVRSWLQRCGMDVDLILVAIENVSRNSSRFDNAEHSYRTVSAHVNRAVEKRRAEAQVAA